METISRSVEEVCHSRIGKDERFSKRKSVIALRNNLLEFL